MLNRQVVTSISEDTSVSCCMYDPLLLLYVTGYGATWYNWHSALVDETSFVPVSSVLGPRGINSCTL